MTPTHSVSLPFSDWRKYDTVFITPSSLQQTSTFISVTLPHSLTSSQGQSEDQFLLKSPAPPLASAPAGILGSWPLPPPPGRCWYDCGSERLLVGQLEWIKKWTTVTFRGHQIITCTITLFVKMNSREPRLSSGRSHQCAACHCYRWLHFCFQMSHKSPWHYQFQRENVKMTF